MARRKQYINVGASPDVERTSTFRRLWIISIPEDTPAIASQHTVTKANGCPVPMLLCNVLRRETHEGRTYALYEGVEVLNADSTNIDIRRAVAAMQWHQAQAIKKNKSMEAYTNALVKILPNPGSITVA